MRTANKGTSRAIFERLKKDKKENPKPFTLSESVSSSEQESQNETTDVSMVSTKSDVSSFSRGAADSMRDREKRRKQDKDIESVKNKSVKKKIQINESDEYFVDLLKMSAVNEDSGTIVRSLLGLYLSGTLESYEIDGLNRKEILSVLDDFRREVDSVLT